MDCPGELEIIVAALRGELPWHDRASREHRARIREVIEADVERVDLLAAANTDVDGALYYERTSARLRHALAELERTEGSSLKALVSPSPVVASAKRAAPKPARAGAADSARVRVQTQAAGAALLGAA